jgi:hypothetical protein
MDIESVFLRAMFQATDNWILRGGPEPNDKAILALAPELAGLIAAAYEPEEDEEDGMEWIPVTERLPELLTEVLGWHPADRVRAWFRHSGQPLNAPYWELWEPQDRECDDCKVKAPTHWMPLPAPPNDDK